MRRSARVVGIIAALALAAVGQAANATSQTRSVTPYATEKAFNDAVLPLTGKVVETMDAGGYTYVLLEKKGDKTWVAVPRMKVTVGEEVSFQPGQEMNNFTSKSLKRTFPKIYFSSGSLVGKDEAIKSAHPPKAP